MSAFDPSTGLQPIGIIRTLPSLYGDKAVGAKRYRMSLQILYLYLIVEGKVDVRLNIAGYEPGDARECWDRTIRQPKIWATCTGPVVRPKDPVLMRGFQGFRYVYERLF